MIRPTRPGLVAVAAIAVALGACSDRSAGTPGAGSPAPGTSTAASACAKATGSGTVTVTIKDFAYSPSPAQAKVGDVITFTNEDGAPHSAVLDTDSGCATDRLEKGASGSLTFSAPGTYAYHCGVHGNSMKGTLTVTG